MDEDISFKEASRTSLKTFRLGRHDLSSGPEKRSSLLAGKFSGALGWKAILLVQFQHQFIFAVYVGILVSYCIVVYEASKALAVMENEGPLAVYMTDAKGIVYSFDAFYAVDVIFMIVYKNTEWPEFIHRYKPRNAAILQMEFLTLIPMDAIYYTIARSKKESSVELLRLRYVFRLIRLFYDHGRSAPVTKDQSMAQAMIGVLVGIAVVCITLAVIVEPYVCEFRCLPQNITATFYYNLYVSTEKITGKGFGESYYHHILGKGVAIHMFSFAGFLAYLGMGYLISKAICTFISKDKHVYSFLIKYTSIKKELREWKKRNISTWKVYDECFYNTIRTYYKMIWDKRRWFVTRAFEEQALPMIMFKELYLDMSWNAFKHSHLFKDQDIHFLREISTYMNHTVYAPGEIIYSRHRPKSAMVYIRTGIVQILSEENGETPIISFSGGTCLGESSLIIDYLSNWSVTCKTYCEVACLKRKDFIRVSFSYPRTYRKLARTIRNRYREARKHRRFLEYQWCEESVSNPETVTLTWLKKTLHRLAESDDNYRRDDWNENLTFCPDYLDLLVITGDIELVSDRIFLKKKFPAIFQPDSIFLDGWNIFIGIVAFVLLLAYPCYMLNCNKLWSTTHLMILVMLTFIWSMDIYIQSCTAIRTKDTLLSTVSSIIYYRLTNTGFLIDIFSALPFSVVFTLTDSHLSYETLLLTESHKLFKAYRMKFIFGKVQMLNLKNKAILKYVMVFMLDFFLFYYTATIFYYIICHNGECPAGYEERILKITDNPTKWHILLHFYTLATLFLGNMSFVDFLQYISYDTLAIIIILQFVYVFVHIFIMSKTAIMETLRQRKVHQYKEFVSTMDVVMKDMNVSLDLQNRVKVYLKDLFWVDKGLRVLIPNLFQTNMSYNLYSITNQVRYRRFLHDIPLFAELDECVIIDATRTLNVTHYPPGEVITYAGEVCKEMHVIEFGFCKVLGSQDKVLEPSDSFCVIETCIQIPTFYTIVTLTDCKVLSMSYIEFARFSSRYPEFRQSVKRAIKYSVSEEDINQIQSTYREAETLVLPQEGTVPFSRTFKWTTLQEKRKYQREFKTYMVLFRYLLMKHTFPPHGKFLFYWEISRMLFAFATNIFSSYTYSPVHGFVYYLSVCMDATAWIDLYVRHHVCYYNEDGIEISHPAKTCVHYWKNALLVDFLACVPMDYFAGSASTKSYWRTNRFLQLHRPFNFLRHMSMNSIFRSRLYDTIKYVPLFLLAIDFLSTINIFTTCSSIIEINLTNPSCAVEHWAKVHLNESNVSPTIKQHASSLLITTMTLTRVSFHHIELTSMSELWNTCVLFIAGHIFLVWLTARLVSTRFYRKTDLTVYQEAMRHLLAFVATRKIDKNIKNEIITYYEFMWKKTKGKNLVLLLNAFSTAIKEDILYDMFGKSISASTIFSTAPKSFLKSLLLESKYEVYVHKGIIYRVNDINGYIYILLRGTIDVLGADYNKLLVLSPGSTFGNLGNCYQSRQTLSMIAKGYVEVLKISTVYFHLVTSKYPSVMRQFNMLTAFNVDYLENMEAPITAKTSTTTLRSRISMATTRTHDFPLTPGRKQKSAALIKKKRRCRLFSVVFEESGWIRIAQLVIASVCCFLGFHLEVYQLSNYDDNVAIISMLYFCDFLYLIKMYLHFHTTYLSESGLQVTDAPLIAKYYLNQRFGFYFDLITVLPWEILSLFFIYQSYFWNVWTWLRKNRLIRIGYFLHVLKVSQAKLHVNVKVVRIMYMIAWLTVLLQTMSSSLLTIYNFNTPEAVGQSKLGLLVRSYEIITYAASCSALSGVQFSFDMHSVITTFILMLVCKFFVTLLIAELCSLIENAHQNKSKYQIFTLYLKYQIKEEDVSVPLSKRIGEYLNLLWIHHRGVQFPSLLTEAPYYLKEAILNAMYGFHLRRHPLIKHCHTDLIRQMAATFDVLIFFPGNVVAYEGDIDGCMYFIHKGEVESLVEDTLYSEKVVDTLQTGECFGLDQGLYKNCGHDYSYKVTKKSIIIALNKDKWFHLLQFFPASKRVLFELRSTYMLA